MIRLVINWAPLSGDRAERQQNAWKSIEALMATNEDFVATTVVCPGDPTDGVPALSGVLPRRIGRRNLPYIHDLLDHAHGLATDGDWIGFLNSDVIPTQQFIGRVKASDKRFVMCNVTDTDATRGEIRFRPQRGGSIDGVMMTPRTWGEIRSVVPEMVLGSQAWDTAFVLWSMKHMDSSEWMLQSELLHVLHGVDHWALEGDEAHSTNLAAISTVGGMDAGKRLSFFEKPMENRRGAPYRRAHMEKRMARGRTIKQR